MNCFRSFCLRPVTVTAVILSWISSSSVAFAAPASLVDLDSVVVQKVELNSGKTEFFAVKATDLLNDRGEIKITRDKFDGVVTHGKAIPKEQIQNWKNAHPAEGSRGIQASLSLSDGSQVPLKNVNQLSAEVLRLNPDGAVAKHVKWSIEHEADLVRGEQSWFWLGFLVGGLSFLALSYLFAPAPTYYAVPAPGYYYYYGVYRPW